MTHASTGSGATPGSGTGRSIDEHVAAALALVAPLAAVNVGVDQAVGHVLVEDVVAPAALPRWDNSGMDGFAVRRQDVLGASPDTPVTLEVLADLPAGTAETPEVRPGTAARIMTGAPVPPGADAVVPVELTDALEPQLRGEAPSAVVRILQEPALGAHVRRAGEDVSVGDLVLAAGTLLGPAQVAAAAAVGHGEVTVRRRPRVAVMSTGSELVPPGEPLRRGQIPDTNSYLLAELVRAAGGTPIRLGAVPDDALELRGTLDRLESDGVDAIITSGGVSMGAFDVVKEVLRDEPGMAFVQVPMQPGKPQGLGRLRGGTPMFALPGNPVSSFVSFEVFVRPALLRMRGLTEVERPRITCVAAEGWNGPPGRTQYIPVRFVPGADAVPRVVPSARGGSGSHLVASLARCEGLAVVDAATTRVEAGDRVRVMRVDR